MATKKSQSDNSDNSDTTISNNNLQSTTSGKKTSIMLYIAVIVAIFIIIALVYYGITYLGNKSSSKLTGQNIFNNLTNQSLNQTQLRFVDDLKLSQSLGALHVIYYSSNATEYLPALNNVTLAINSNQTINSYTLGKQNASSITQVLAYTNTKTNQVVAKNVSEIAYYNTTNSTISCFNDSVYGEGPYGLAKTNSSLQCYSGDGGASFLEGYPFRITNVSSIAALIYEGNMTYQGTKMVIGRSCDSFVISNETSANLLSNYSVDSMCIDTQYGVPLYFNETDVIGGKPYPALGLTATLISTNVPQSAFNIPVAYSDNVSSSLI
jgi:hypothetical protein